MRLAWNLGLLTSLAACAPTAPPALSPTPSPPSPADSTAAQPPLVAPSSAPDPCAAEQTTLGIVTCVSESVQRIESDIQAALTRFTSVLHARGVADAAALVAASQADWERYRGSQCQLFEKLSEGGSLARVAVAYCRRDLAAARLSDLASLERSVVE